MICTVIPCRTGSKEVPDKNLKFLGGHSLAEHAVSIARALNYPWVVSTNSSEVSHHLGLAEDQVVYAFPPLCHGDNSLAIDVWQDAWERIEEAHMTTFEIGVYLEPSSPFREIQMVEQCIDMVASGEYSTAFTVEHVPLKYHTLRQVMFSGEEILFPPVFGKMRRQDYPESYVRNGACYVTRREMIFERHDLYADTCGLVITEPLINIDTQDDLEAARARWNESVLH